MNDKKKPEADKKREVVRDSVRKNPDYFVPDKKNPPPPTQDPRDKSRSN